MVIDLTVNNVETFDGSSRPLVCNYSVVTILKGGQIQFLGDVRFICQKIVIRDSSLPAMIIGADNSKIMVNLEIVNGKFVMDLSGNPNGTVNIAYKTLESGATIHVVPKATIQQYS